MKRIEQFVKNHLVSIVIYIFIIFACTIKLPYYIDAPGGLINIGERIELGNKYESEGSINLAYVSEYSVNLPMLILSYFNDDWELHKIQTEEEKETYEEDLIRSKLMMEESYNNAIILAFKKANQEIEIVSTDMYVAYLVEEADTDLVVGDKILKIDGIEIDNKEALSIYLSTLNVGEKITIDVMYNNQEFKRYAKLIDYDGTTIIGFSPVEINKFESNPKITIPTDASEYGPSGGLMISLAVYDAITEQDITGGLTIVGTGTIDLDGNVGSIGGVEFKIKGAERKHADIFFVPVGENYETAKKIVEANNYKIKLVPVETFDDALNYLLENVAK